MCNSGMSCLGQCVAWWKSTCLGAWAPAFHPQAADKDKGGAYQHPGRQASIHLLSTPGLR